MTDSEFLWPEKGDSLFKESDRSTDAWIRPSEANNIIFPVAYFEAAIDLIKAYDTVEERNTAVIYPILYLLRHSYELDLKFIIYTDRRKRNLENPVTHHHKIKDLWLVAKGHIQENEPNRDDSIDAVKKMLLELAVEDPKSMTYRYPIDLKRNQMIEEEKFFDLRHLGESATKVHNFLNGVGSQFMEMTHPDT